MIIVSKKVKQFLSDIGGIMERTTQELFDVLKSKLIIDLKDNEVLCPTCKGLRMNYAQEGEKGYIDKCNDCYNGKLYECKHCGRLNKTDWCNCNEANGERMFKRREKERQELEGYLKTAKIVKFEDYNGYFMDKESVLDSDEFADLYLDSFKKESSPLYTYSVEGEKLFSLDIYDIINDKTNDGYEEMYSYLSTESHLLTEVQKLLIQWEEENERALKVYRESVNTIIDLTSLYEKGLAII
jgi:hypothetical protein